ncbi:MAG TPA: ribonuclease R [Cytophagaceae bacterium]
MSKKNKKASEANTNEIKDRILTFFKNSKKNAFSIKELIKKLNLKKKDQKSELSENLNDLVKKGSIMRLKNGSFKSASDAKFITGTVDYVSPRFAYIISPDSEEDIYVSANKLGNALDGDTVRVLLYPIDRKRREKRPEGEVVEIIERRRDEFVGKIELNPRFAFVVCDGKKMHYDIFIPLEKINNAKHGEKVVVKILEWPTKDKNPVGEVVQVLGKAGENDVEMHAIMAEFGLPMEFPKAVLREAEAIPTEIPKEEIAKRRDFRDILTFTIDPFDAKDFDDALSIRKLDNGNWEVGVHIADVTHYVKPDSIIEKEGYNRATSVYLVDRVVPMLPEKLSNELCSLRPNEDKLTFSAVFELDKDGHVKDEWYGKTVIHSNRRFTYEEVQQIIEEKQGDYAEEILVLNQLAHKLREDRFKKGAIGFETVEVKFRLDEKGKPLEVVPKIRKDAHKLIEDFMLLANRKVAEYVRFMKKGKEKNTMVYRIHEHPSTEKLNALAIFAKKFGHQLNLSDEHQVANQLNKLVEDIEGLPEQNVLQSLAIRSMAKARYSTEPEIHFGLAYKHYTHFTSPIRRYPDMMVHRLLEHYLNGGKSVEKDYYEEKCIHSSEMEKRAADAERASIKYKQVEYMKDMVEKEFEGIVSGVMEYGIFVEIIETKCEGMVRLSELEDDFYELDEQNFRVIGKKNKRIITLGDHVQVKVKKTDLFKRTIDLSLLS